VAASRTVCLYQAAKPIKQHVKTLKERQKKTDTKHNKHFRYNAEYGDKPCTGQTLVYIG